MKSKKENSFRFLKNRNMLNGEYLTITMPLFFFQGLIIGSWLLLLLSLIYAASLEYKNEELESENHYLETEHDVFIDLLTRDVKRK